MKATVQGIEILSVFSNTGKWLQNTDCISFALLRAWSRAPLFSFQTSSFTMQMAQSLLSSFHSSHGNEVLHNGLEEKSGPDVCY